MLDPSIALVTEYRKLAAQIRHSKRFADSLLVRRAAIGEAIPDNDEIIADPAVSADGALPISGADVNAITTLANTLKADLTDDAMKLIEKFCTSAGN